MNYTLLQIKKMIAVKTVLITIFCLLTPYTNSCSSQGKKNLTKISGSHESLKFLAMFTPDTNQEDSLNITKDVMFSLMQANFLNCEQKQNLVICESCLETTKVNFDYVRFSQGAVHKKTTVICPDDNNNIRELNCYYGDFSIQVVDFRKH